MNFLWWLRRGLEALVAAIVVLILLQIHTGIVQFALTMVGLRTDVPLIVAINDQCETKYVPPAWIDARPGSSLTVDCDDKISIVATAPQGKQVSLFLNDQLVATRVVASPLVRFDDVRLRLGWNSLIVAEGESRVEFPHPMLRQVWQFGGPWRTPPHMRTFGLEIPEVQPTNFVSLLWAPIKDRVRRDLKPYEQPVTPFWFKQTEKDSEIVVQGLPGTAIGADRDRPFIGSDTFGDDGFSMSYASPVQDATTSPAQKTYPNQTVVRQLTIRGGEDGQIELALSTCLPATHPFVDWARRAVMDAPELITRSTGYFLVDRTKADDQRWRDKRSIVVAEQADKGCVSLTGSYQAGGEIVQFWRTGFLRLRGDKIIVPTALAKTVQPSRPADRTGADEMVWEGGLPGQDPPRFTVSGMDDVVVRGGSTDSVDSMENQERIRAGLLNHWRELSKALPDLMQRMLWGLASMIPVALIYWALGRHRSPMPRKIDRARHGVLALLAFMAAMTLQPVLIEASRLAFDSFRLWSVTLDPARNSIIHDSFAPLAFVVVLMIVPLLRAQELPNEPNKGLARFIRFVSRILLVVLSLALVPLAFGVAVVARWIVAAKELPIPNDLFGDSTISVLLGLLVLGWCALGLLTFWILIYWLARSLLSRGALLGAAFTAAVLMFFLPMITPAAEAVRALLALGTSTYGNYGLGPATLLALAALSSLAGVVIMVTLTLRGFREIAAAMLNLPQDGRFQSWCRNSILFVVAVLIVGPTTGALSAPNVANFRAYQFMGTFQAYGGLLALLALFEALSIIEEAQRNVSIAARFRTEKSVLLLLTAAFAGYLSLWVREPIGAPILAAIGWLVFYYGIIGPPPATMEGPEDGLAKRVLKYRTDQRLRETRLKTFEKKFSDGEIDASNLAAQRTAIEDQDKQAKQALGMPVEEATFRILGSGPGSSPMSNALVGAITGLAVAGLLQVVLPIDFSLASEQKAPSWLTYLQMFIVDPNYRPIGVDGNGSRVLSVVSELINDIAIWVFIGFLFGYLFHRIRGNDGFAKAIVFAAGISVTFLVGQALVARGGGVPVGNLARLIPIFVFLTFLGTLIFDGRSLKREGMPLAQLPDLYGLKTAIGYASFAGVVAGVQPLLHLFDWIFKRGG